MDVQFYGANCLVITTKHARLVIDDNLADLGGKSPSKEGDVALFTGAHGNPKQPAKLVLDQPGEYEVSNVSVFGIAARAHMDTEEVKTAVMYKIVAEDMSLLVIGHVFPKLSDKQLEAIGMVDVVFVPVGGNGYTLDGVGALTLIKDIEPKLVVPTYYDDPSLNFPVPAHTLEEALKAIGMEPKETVAKLKLKGRELLDVTELVVVEKS